MSVAKAEAQQVLDRIPEDASWNDIVSRLSLHAKVQEALGQAERGEGCSQEEMEKKYPEPSRLERRFRQLVSEWKAGRGPQSSVAKMAMHPAYQQIIGLGRDAIPLLLAEMEREPSHWAWALRAITGEDPVPEASRGKLFETAQAWVQWGHEKGYRW